MRRHPPGKGRGDAGEDSFASRATGNANPATAAPHVQVPHDPAPTWLRSFLRGYETQLRMFAEIEIERGEFNPGLSRWIDLLDMERES